MEIEERVKVQAAEQSIGKKGLAALRDRIARKMFSELPAEEQRTWAATASEQAAAAQKVWEQEVSSPASTAPEDRQK